MPSLRLYSFFLITCNAAKAPVYAAFLKYKFFEHGKNFKNLLYA